jgi:hypothetical protein
VDRIDRRYLNAKTDLLRVYTANPFIRLSRPALHLGNEVLKVDPSSLEAGGVDVADVVTNDIHSDLVVLKSGDS